MAKALKLAMWSAFRIIVFSPLSFELIEVAACVAEPFQTQVIDEIQRA